LTGKEAAVCRNVTWLIGIAAADTTDRRLTPIAAGGLTGGDPTILLRGLRAITTRRKTPGPCVGTGIVTSPRGFPETTTETEGQEERGPETTTVPAMFQTSTDQDVASVRLTLRAGGMMIVQQMDPLGSSTRDTTNAAPMTASQGLSRNGEGVTLTVEIGRLRGPVDTVPMRGTPTIGAAGEMEVPPEPPQAVDTSATPLLPMRTGKKVGHTRMAVAVE